jgi:hypothetical protein
MTLVPTSLAVGTTYAAPPDLGPSCPGGDTAQGQVLNGVGETGSDCDDRGVNNAIATAVNILSYIVGVAAIIVVIYSGFKYITAAGETNKVGNAKNTLIYALIGLIIAALAQFLVHFVLNQASNAVDNSPCPAGEHRDTDNKCVK